MQTEEKLISTIISQSSENISQCEHQIININNDKPEDYSSLSQTYELRNNDDRIEVPLEIPCRTEPNSMMYTNVGFHAFPIMLRIYNYNLFEVQSRISEFMKKLMSNIYHIAIWPFNAINRMIGDRFNGDLASSRSCISAAEATINRNISELELPNRVSQEVSYSYEFPSRLSQNDNFLSQFILLEELNNSIHNRLLNGDDDLLPLINFLHSLLQVESNHLHNAPHRYASFDVVTNFLRHHYPDNDAALRFIRRMFGSFIVPLISHTGNFIFNTSHSPFSSNNENRFNDMFYSISLLQQRIMERLFRYRILTNEEIKAIPKVIVTHEDVVSKQDCAICMENFFEKEMICKLYCEHKYHEQCIKRWLKQNSSCPVCRACLIPLEINSFSFDIQLD